MRVILGNGHLEFIRRLAGVIDRNLRRPLNRMPCRNETYRFQKKRRALRTTLRCVIAPMLDHPHRTLSDLKNRGQNFEFLGWEDLVVARGKTAKNRIRRSFDVPYPRYPPAEVFERQFETLQSVPQAADADLDLAFSRKPYRLQRWHPCVTTMPRSPRSPSIRRNRWPYMRRSRRETTRSSHCLSLETLSSVRAYVGGERVLTNSSRGLNADVHASLTAPGLTSRRGA